MSNCKVCNSVINSNRKGKLYCSNSCKQSAYMGRKNGEIQMDLVGDVKCYYPFPEYIRLTKVLKGGYKVSYIEYCFLRSCSKNIVEPKEVERYIFNILEEAYKTNEKAFEQYDEGLTRFRARFFEKSMLVFND